VVTGLTNPVDIQQPADGTQRLFVVEQAGTVRIIQGGMLLATPFLDIRSSVTSGGEMGLLGLAFHPNYSQNRRFFVSYTRTVNGQLQSVIAEYETSAADPNVASTAERVLLTVDQPFENHNGGQIQFGPDGYLYIGYGDGGAGGDPLGNGQNLNTLLGKILRIGVDTAQPYAVPPDNPFVGQAGIRPEIWAWGFRNPWRFSFDRASGRLFVGDVGQSDFEEIDLVERGGNYGWSIMEGAHCYPPPSTGCNTSGLALPIAEYSHSEGNSITGGYVYRGDGIQELRGKYVFGDFGSGRIWQLQETASGGWLRSLLLDTDLNISSFGQDQAGELYAVDYNGAVYRLRKAT
jgi:glucose/arabinose dehydrogenase